MAQPFKRLIQGFRTNAPELKERFEGLLSGADPISNLGIGLLAASGPSQMPVSLGQAFGQAAQFATSRQQAAMQNQAMREAMVQRQRQQQAQEQLAGLLSGASGASGQPQMMPTSTGGQDPRQQMIGLLAQSNPEAFASAMTSGLLGQMFETPEAQEFASPIGKMLGDLDLARTTGNSAAVEQISTAIEQELAVEDKGGEELLSKVLQVRDDVTRNSADFLQAEAGFNKVRAAAQSDSPAADMAMIFGYMKVLDPGSIVREGEFATIENSAGIPERIRGMYNKILRGERLTPEQRQDFLSQAQSQFAPLVEQQQRLVRDAQGFAERNKLPFEDIVPQYVMPTMPPPIEPPARGGFREEAGSIVQDIARDLQTLRGESRQGKRYVFNMQTQQLEEQ